MAVASQAAALPTAPQAGEYFRMEENHTQRFKNRMKLQLLGSIAILEVPGSKPKKPPRVVRLIKVTEDSLTINWPEVSPDWPVARLQSAFRDDAEGMLEDGIHFWKLHKRYSSSEVAALITQHQTPSPLLPLEDAIPASAAASTSAHEEEAHCSTEEMTQPQVRPRAWLDAPFASGRKS